MEISVNTSRKWNLSLLNEFLLAKMLAVEGCNWDTGKLINYVFLLLLFNSARSSLSTFIGE